MTHPGGKDLVIQSRSRTNTSAGSGRYAVVACLAMGIVLAVSTGRSTGAEPKHGAHGAHGAHWAYGSPHRPELPRVQEGNWVRNPIDLFILRRLEDETLSPSPRADSAKLVRRLYLDLIGLPPSPAQVDAFAADPSPHAYERLVDQLLASPQFGEKWARHWLDLARYADSNGYQADQLRDNWVYRDWVIRALNDDMPFTQFTIEQIAGDLLPGATVSQRVATGFHRMTTCNVEAGVQPQENRVNQVFDRVDTTGMVWLGTTIECAQCHDHKYDPFSQKDYYQLFAFFNNTPLEVKNPDKKGVQFDFYGPKMQLPQPEAMAKTRDELNHKLAKLMEQKKAVETKHAETSENSGDSENAPQPAQTAALSAIDERIKLARKELAEVEPPTTLVMVEMDQARATHVLNRGDYLNPGEQVAPATPGVLGAMPADAPRNRLGLARWLVSNDNPLTARVTVNRLWAQFFGRGIVTTLEDFGTQGARPTHPRLLDWLAVEFMRGGWRIKPMLRLMVTSATYQQSSRISPQLLEKDPANALYARGPRFRMSAEMVRDNALAIGGLLSPKMFGPPVMPPQPEGIWRHVGRNAPKWRAAETDDRFRRGIYVIWRRSAPYPSMVNFDAPDRASCVVDRSRTNTPLQALTLLNDPAYMECALGLAARIMKESPGANATARLVHAFRICVARPPTAEELADLQNIFNEQHHRFKLEPEAASTLLNGVNPRVLSSPENPDPTEMATWTTVAHILLNLDEVITKG